MRRPGFNLATLAATLSLCACGCRHWNLYEDEPFRPEVQELTQGLRPVEANSRSTAVSAKGKQIDHNFGIGAK